jgi:hypothetical protein
MRFLLTSLLMTSLAFADAKRAEESLRTKIFDGYAQGWSVRTATSVELGDGQHRVYLVTLYAGNEYRVLAAGDDAVSNIDIALYDSAGQQVSADSTEDRDPVLTYKPAKSDSYYVAVHASKLNDPKVKGWIATAVTYR